MKYVEFTEQHKDPAVGIWRLVCGLLLLMLNLLGKQIKNEPTMEYMMRKVVESFFFMRQTADPVFQPDYNQTKID